jgi:hypothetical protein
MKQLERDGLGAGCAADDGGRPGAVRDVATSEKTKVEETQ